MAKLKTFLTIAIPTSVLGIIWLAKKVAGAEGQCYTVDFIGTGPSEPYYYATYLGPTLSILEAFGETNEDIFIVELFVDGLYTVVTGNDTINKNQKFRFQVVRTTEICNIRMESP